MTDAYAMVHFIDVGRERLQDSRRKYDPRYRLIGPHITLVFPLHERIGVSRLGAHVDAALRRWCPFTVRLRRLWCSDDAHLYLVPDIGADELARMHDELYTGPLAPHLRADMPFVPHVTLGVFGERSHGCVQALAEVKAAGVEIACTLDRLHLVRINEGGTRVLRVREFMLRSR